MSDFGSWLQDNWYELGTLLTLMAFLAASVWFARNILKTMRTFQHQVGAFLKLSLASAAPKAAKTPSAKDALAEGISSWLETPAIDSPKTEDFRSNRIAFDGSRLWSWLRVPIRAAGAAPRRMVRWLQAPVGS